MEPNKRLVFSTAAYRYLRDELCAVSGDEPGEVDTKHFPDGERYLRIRSRVDGRDVAIVAGTISDADTLELFDLSCAIVKYGARSLTLVVPYFGYSTMERATASGEVVTAKTRARLLSAIPEGDMPNRIVLVDLHTEGLTHYFEGSIRPLHVSASPIVVELVRSLVGQESYVLACTDAGRAKWVETLANAMGVTASFVFKKRIDGEQTQVTAVSAHVEGKTVVIYDDMIRTGSSLVGAARAYRDSGAARMVAIATHGIFPGESLAKIESAGVIEHIAVTDTHPRARELAGPFLTVAPIAPLLARALHEERPW